MTQIKIRRAHKHPNFEKVVECMEYMRTAKADLDGLKLSQMRSQIKNAIGWEFSDGAILKYAKKLGITHRPGITRRINRAQAVEIFQWLNDRVTFLEESLGVTPEPRPALLKRLVKKEAV
jgi:hypothetical protein